jgi:hypothetical protein
MDPVAGDHRGDRVRSLGREHECEATAHAVAHDADLVDARSRPQLVDRPGELRGRGGELEGHHLLGGLVGLVERHLPPVVEVGGQSREPGGGESVARRFDLGHESPPLLDHDHAGSTGGTLCQVAPG